LEKKNKDKKPVVPTECMRNCVAVIIIYHIVVKIENLSFSHEKKGYCSLMMHIVTTRGGDKPKHWVTMKLKRSTKLKWPAIDKLCWKAVSDG